MSAQSCSRCGWLHHEATCPSCQLPQSARTPLIDEAHPSLGGARPEDYPELRVAFQAWSTKDWSRMIGQCLVSLGVPVPLIAKRPTGPAWAFTQDSVAVFIHVHLEREQVSIESPLVRLPATRRVPLMRTLLELNHQQTGAARFCLRDDLVVLRFSDQLQNVSPPKIVDGVRHVALIADEWDDLLAMSFDARMVGPKINQQPDWKTMGEPVKLARLEAPEAPLPMLAADALSAPSPLELEEQTPLFEPKARSAHAEFELDLGIDAPLENVVEAPPEISSDFLIVEPPERTALCTLLERALELVEVARKQGPEHAAFTARAAVFLATERHRGDCPEAIDFLLLRSAPAVARPKSSARGLLDRVGLSGTPLPAVPLDNAIKEVLAERANLGTQPKPTVPKITDLTELKSVSASLLVSLRALPEAPVLRELVGAGILAELLVRASVGDRISVRLRDEIKNATGDGARAVRLERVVERMAQ